MRTIALIAVAIALPVQAQTLLWDTPMQGDVPSTTAIDNGWEWSSAVKSRGAYMAVPMREKGAGSASRPSVGLMEIATGNWIWRTTLPTPCDMVETYYTQPAALSVAFFRNGDVAVASAALSFDGGRYPHIACLARLDAHDGHIVWLHTEQSADPYAGGRGFTSVAVTSADDVVVSGFAYDDPNYTDAQFAAHSGATGAQLWRFVDAAPATTYEGASIAAESVALGDGGVVVSLTQKSVDGSLTNCSDRLLKIDAAGQVAWSTDLPSTTGICGAKLQNRADGDLLWYRTYAEELNFVRGDTGQVVWSRRFTLDGDFRFPARRIASSGAGDLFVAGYSEAYPEPGGEALQRVSAADGHTVWRSPIAQPYAAVGDDVLVTQLTVAADGSAMAKLGATDLDSFADPSAHASLARFDYETGQIEWSLEQGDLHVRDRGEAFFVADDQSELVDVSLRCFGEGCGVVTSLADAGTGTQRLDHFDPTLAPLPVRPPTFGALVPRAAALSTSKQALYVLGRDGLDQLNVSRVDVDDGHVVWNSGRIDQFPLTGIPEGLSTCEDGVLVQAASGVSGASRNAVLKLAADDGRVLWSQSFAPSEDLIPYDDSASMLADAECNGLIVTPASPTQADVRKLDSTDGSERWRTLVDGAARTQRLVMDAAGSVLLVSFDDAAGAHIRKLDSSTGALRWDAVIPIQNSSARTVESAGNGDVFFSGDFRLDDGSQRAMAGRVSGVDGSLVWINTELPASARSSLSLVMTLDQRNDALVGITSGACNSPNVCAGSPQWIVVRLDAQTGNAIWTWRSSQADGPRDMLTALTIGQGSVIAAGQGVLHGQRAFGMSVEDGTSLWSFGNGLPADDFDSDNYVPIVAYTGSGRVLMVGSTGSVIPDSPDAWQVTTTIVPVRDEAFSDGFD